MCIEMKEEKLKPNRSTQCSISVLEGTQRWNTFNTATKRTSKDTVYEGNYQCSYKPKEVLWERISVGYALFSICILFVVQFSQGHFN